VSHLERVFSKSAGITVSHFFSMLPSTLKYLYSVEPEPVRMHFPAKSRVQITLCAMLHSSIAHSMICTRLFRGKMHSDCFWLKGIQILQDRWQHGEKVGYSYTSGHENTLCKWDIYVPLVTKGFKCRVYVPLNDMQRRLGMRGL